MAGVSSGGGLVRIAAGDSEVEVIIEHPGKEPDTRAYARVRREEFERVARAILASGATS